MSNDLCNPYEFSLHHVWMNCMSGEIGITWGNGGGGKQTVAKVDPKSIASMHGIQSGMILMCNDGKIASDTPVLEINAGRIALTFAKKRQCPLVPTITSSFLNGYNPSLFCKYYLVRANFIKHAVKNLDIADGGVNAVVGSGSSQVLLQEYKLNGGDRIFLVNGIRPFNFSHCKDLIRRFTGNFVDFVMERFKIDIEIFPIEKDGQIYPKKGSTVVSSTEPIMLQEENARSIPKASKGEKAMAPAPPPPPPNPLASMRVPIKETSTAKKSTKPSAQNTKTK